MTADRIGAILGQDPVLELMSLYAQALRELGRFLGDRTALAVVRAAGGSAERLAETLASGMAMYDDAGFYKRAQIVGSDMSLAGVDRFSDLGRLTIFADNLVPHVLRCDGVLVYEDALAARIDAGELIPMDRREREIRGCAVHATELLSQRLGVTPMAIDMWLWNRGQGDDYKARPAAPLPQRLLLAPGGGTPAPADRVALDRAAGGRPGRGALALQRGQSGLQLADAGGHALHRLGDGVGQVRPVGVGALGPDARRCAPGAPVADDGRVGRHVVDDDGVGADLGPRGRS